MRAAFVSRLGGLEISEVERPQLGDGDVMVQMKASGICGTDLEKLSGGYTESKILGHEVSGVVIESKSALFGRGDRVVPHHHVACGECYFCLHGAETMCEGFRTSNFEPGGFADEFKVKEYNVSRGGVHRMPDEMSFEEASFAEPLGCCIRALNKTLPKLNRIENVLVVGAGPIGLLHMEILHSRLPLLQRLVAADVSTVRLDFAERSESAIPLDVKDSAQGLFSADALTHARKGYDLVIVATGNTAAFAESMRCVRKSGALLLFGAPHKGSTYSLDLQSMLLRELTLQSSYATSEVELEQALNLLKGKEIDVKKFVTSKYPLERAREAMSAALSESEVKVLVTG